MSERTVKLQGFRAAARRPAEVIEHGVAGIDPVWLFPPTYALHLSEEYFIGGGFPLWAERVSGIRFTNADFVVWNAFALLLMFVAAWLVSRDPKFRFVEIALAIAVLGNVAAHALGSLVTWTYSPGLMTSVVVWAPFGAIRLQSARRASSSRGRRAGTCIGLSVVLITIAAVMLAAIVSR